MNFKEYENVLIKLQDPINSAIKINDVLFDIIEVGFSNTGEATYCPPHSHTWFEFNYVISGSFFTSFREEMHEIKEEMFFLIPPGLEHSHRYNNKNPHNDIFFRWQIKKNNDIEINDKCSIYKQLEPLFLYDHVCFMKNDTVKILIEQLLRDVKNGALLIDLQLDFINILVAIKNIYLKNIEAKKEDDIQSYDSDIKGRTIIKKVEIYLNDNNFEDFDVHKLAASMHMSYGHLARLYKKYTGQTIIDRLCSIRLEKSCMLLEKTDYSMKEIAEKLEFSNQYYFSKVFKEKNGISPSQYRKSYSKYYNK